MQSLLRRAIALTAFLFSSVSVHAQTESSLSEELAAARQRLLGEALAAQNAGDHVSALAAAERAGRIEMSPSVRMFIAQELVALERWVPALNTASVCLRELQASPPSLRNRESIQARCREFVTQAERHVGYVLLTVSSETPGLRVTINNTAIAAQFYDVPYPMLVGRARVVAEAPERERFEADVTVEPALRSIVRISLAAARSPSTNTPRTIPTGAIALWTGGGVALLAGAGLLLGRVAAQGDCMPSMDGRYLDCPTPAAYQSAEPAYALHVSGFVALGLGLSAGAAGTLFWLLSPRSNPTDRSTARNAPSPRLLSLLPERRGASFVLGGVW